jgi:hypothetical protein
MADMADSRGEGRVGSGVVEGRTAGGWIRRLLRATTGGSVLNGTGVNGAELCYAV